MYSWTKLKNTFLVCIECIVIESIFLKNKLLENVSTAYIDHIQTLHTFFYKYCLSLCEG